MAEVADVLEDAAPLRVAKRASGAVSPIPGTASLGHEDAFTRPRLSARCRISQGPFAGTRGNGRDAPIPDLPCLTPERGGSTQIGRSLYPTTMVGHGPQSRSQLSHTSFKHLRLICSTFTSC